MYYSYDTQIKTIEHSEAFSRQNAFASAAASSCQGNKALRAESANETAWEKYYGVREASQRSPEAPAGPFQAQVGEALREGHPSNQVASGASFYGILHANLEKVGR